MAKSPMVSSFSIALKKATMITEDITEAKKEHRSNLRTLTDKYMQDVADGKVEGIRNAKELVEVIKADLLLMGEATERTAGDTLDEVRVAKITQAIDPNDPNVQSLMDQVFAALNNANDEEDTTS